MDQSFMDYRNALDAAMMRYYWIDTYDMGLSDEEIAAYQKAGDKPDLLAEYFGRKYDLRVLPEITQGGA